MKLFSITHLAFQTDHLDYISTLVYGQNASEALKIFNLYAALREAYPYCWREAELKDIKEASILNNEYPQKYIERLRDIGLQTLDITDQLRTDL